jgi:hypothetical protein
MPLLLLLLLVAGCASPGHELQRGSAVAPPPVRPGYGAPVVGQPGQQAPAFPRSPHRRVLPPSREPGLWAGDALQASRSEPQGGPELAKATLSQEALGAEDEAAREKEDSAEADAAEAEGEAAPEPPDCQGQNHHVISRPIAKALGRHKTLRGLYEPRDRRFEAKAKDKESHCGYQQWHRDVDLEVIRWLRRYEEATPEQFMRMLREIYSREDMLKRFPNGFGPAT